MHQSAPIATFSIVAAAPDQGELGIAVQSKFLAVGAVVPYAQAGIGAVATQSYANTGYGARGLELMASGMHPQEVIARLTGDDPEREQRQVGVVDAQGRSAAFTGSGCHAWAGHVAGKHYAAQGNILVGEATVQSMATTFEHTTGTLAERLLAALAAGQAAGGDRRGRQSASLLVVKPHGGYGGWTDRWLDLRVDDHPTPIVELKRLFGLHQLYFGEATEHELLPLNVGIVTELQERLARLGFFNGTVTGDYDPSTQKAMDDWAGIENLEERLRDDGLIDLAVLAFLRKQSP